MNALQCPRCVLRFQFANELRDHLDQEHPNFRSHAGSVVADLLSACHCNHRGWSNRPHASRNSTFA